MDHGRPVLSQHHSEEVRGLQKPVGHFIRAVLLMPLYVPLFSPKAASSETAGNVYYIVLKVCALRCLVLTCLAVHVPF